MVNIYCGNRFIGNTLMVKFSIPGGCTFENNKSIKLDLLNPDYKIIFKSKTLGGRKIKMSVENISEVEVTDKSIKLVSTRIKPWEFE